MPSRLKTHLVAEPGVRLQVRFTTDHSTGASCRNPEERALKPTPLPRHHQGRLVEELCCGRWAGLDEVIGWEAMMPLLSFSKEELLELHYQERQTGVVHL